MGCINFKSLRVLSILNGEEEDKVTPIHEFIKIHPTAVSAALNGHFNDTKKTLQNIIKTSEGQYPGCTSLPDNDRSSSLIVEDVSDFNEDELNVDRTVDERSLVRTPAFAVRGGLGNLDNLPKPILESSLRLEEVH